MTIKSLDTTYAGCRFRSRLEARWAVLLDHLDIRWEYEPQGYEVSHRVTGAEGAFRYLPDFWLPDLGVWGEVKGDLSDDEAARLVDAAASLSSNDSGGCHDDGGHDLAVFGHLTHSWDTGQPIRLHMHKGILLASCLWCNDPHNNYTPVADDCGGPPPGLAALLLRGYWCARHNVAPRHLSAIDAARTARFEHGAKPRKARK